jgi:DNA-binding beta-propeller fold protein YncE
MWRAGGAAALVLLLAAGPGPAAAQEGPPQRPDTRQVMFVGNNWEGTADIVDARSFERLARINTIPDKEERLAEIQRDPERLAFFLAIRQFVGEGNDQYTDDMFTSHDGRFVYVSRPSFADVVGISLDTGRIVWRFPMEGQRSDHMAISPDGQSLLVSDSTANKVHRLDTRTGRKTGEFPSGDSPHENNYSKDGSLIFHASIGRVYTPTDQSLTPPLELIRDTTKGERYFQVVDANTMQVLERVDMGQKLEEAGYPEMDSAVRPMALSPDEKTLYAQISFHHGFIEYDLDSDRVTRVANLPLSEEARNTPREDYLLDSAHHGLAMNPEGTKLCAAGTMSDYAAIVRRDSFAHTIIPIGKKPYWSTNGLGGTHCWLSVSGDDKVVIIDYASERQVAQVPVGDHPQRVRLGAVRHTTLAGLPTAPGARDNAAPHIRVIRPKRCRHRRLRAKIRIFDQSPLRYAAARAPKRSRKTTRKRFRLTVPLKDLQPGKRYRIRVRAKDTAGNFSRKVVRFRRCR